MRDLNMMEIEQVSGAGWGDWWGGVQESIQQWMGSIVPFFSDAPQPTTQDIRNVQELCRYGLPLSVTWSTSSMTFSGPTVTLSFTKGGTWTATCFPAGGEPG